MGEQCNSAKCDGTRIVLASGSPRRRELMRAAGLNFDIDVPGTDESHYSYIITEPRRLVLQLAYSKAYDVWKRRSSEVVVAADTVVYDGTILGKPRDADDARRMLNQLSGRTHQVLTGVCVMGRGSAQLHCEVSEVHFKPLSAAQIDEYVATGESLDKAGAYAIQGGGRAFVESCFGDRDNMIGLPVKALLKMLGRDSADDA